LGKPWVLLADISRVQSVDDISKERGVVQTWEGMVGNANLWHIQLRSRPSTLTSSCMMVRHQQRHKAVGDSSTKKPLDGGSSSSSSSSMQA